MSDPTRRTAEDITADLEIAEAEVAAGLTVPLEPVLQRLRDSIAQLEAKHEPQARYGAAPLR